MDKNSDPDHKSWHRGDVEPTSAMRNVFSCNDSQVNFNKSIFRTIISTGKDF